jgi:hypothetical protein
MAILANAMVPITVITDGERIPASSKRPVVFSKRSVCVLAAVLIVSSTCASMRSLLSELILSPDLLLNELRLFNPDRRYLEPFAGSYAALIDDAIESDSAVHANFALCSTRFREAILKGDAAAARAARGRCVVEIEKGLRRTPSNGSLWLERADLLLQTGDSGPPLLHALRASFVTARREGWLMHARLIIILRAWPNLPDDIRRDAIGDIDQMLSSEAIVDSLIQMYIQHPAWQPTIGEMVTKLTKERQERFIYLIRAALGNET